MREITAKEITAAVRQLCIDANRVLPADLEAVIQDCSRREKDETARSILCDLCRNLDAARRWKFPSARIRAWRWSLPKWARTCTSTGTLRPPSTRVSGRAMWRDCCGAL